MTTQTQKNLWIGVVTLFPQMMTGLSEYGVVGRAIRNGLLDMEMFDPRDYTQDKHRRVDDRPYGGGPGMVMQVQPLRDAIEAAKQVAGDAAKVIYLSPQGRCFTQTDVATLVDSQPLIMVAGRYEGIDERFIEACVDEEWSIGDYVLSGGELPAMVMIDAMARTLPGALGDDESAEQDSFVNGLLDYPHYTRPESVNDRAVPDVLMSGDHAAIESWRMQQALGRTWLRRPELLEELTLDEEQQALLESFIKQHEQS